MERSTPVRKPHTSTADLLTWSDTPPADSSAATRSAVRSHQPSDGISKVVFGGQVTDDEVESLNTRKPCSVNKKKEMTGSGIFVFNGEDNASESGNVTGQRIYQHALAGISHISFGEEESISPKKHVTLPEVAKQRELSGTLESEAEAKLNKQISDAKCKELSGHNIFAPPPDIVPMPTTARTLDLKGNIEIGETSPRNPAGAQSNEENVLKTAKKIYDKKFSELSGSNIFKDDANPTSADKHLSTAKLQEISGNDIFADGKAESRDYLGGVRKPPGGESSIALV